MFIFGHLHLVPRRRRPSIQVSNNRLQLDNVGSAFDNLSQLI